MITESKIKAAVRAVENGRPRVELRDGGGRGAGRLVLIVRAKAATVTTEFYAQWYRDERRVMSKLGSYPIISLADARKRFREEFAPANRPAPSSPAWPPVDGTARRPAPSESCSVCCQPASGRQALCLSRRGLLGNCRGGNRIESAGRRGHPGRYRSPPVGDPRSRGQGPRREGPRLSERSIRLWAQSRARLHPQRRRCALGYRQQPRFPQSR
jgi:hypothetical protein